jgi:hypothetical protein
MTLLTPGGWGEGRRGYFQYEALHGRILEQRALGDQANSRPHRLGHPSRQLGDGWHRSLHCEQLDGKKLLDALPDPNR